MSKNDTKIDFSLSELEKNNFQDFLNNKEKEVQSKISKQQTVSKIRNWGVVVILAVSLFSLSLLYFFQTRENNSRLDTARNQLQQIAGMMEENSKNQTLPAITGEAVAIKPKTIPPDEFGKSTDTVEFRFLTDKQGKPLEAQQTSFIANILVNNQELKSGIVVQVVEYDDKHSRQSFADLVLQELGGDFKIESRAISIPKNFQLTKISDGEREYYTGVTTDYYYFIKIYRQTRDLAEYSKINKFTDSILENLFLN